MKWLHKFLRNKKLKTRLIFGFMILPLTVMVICFLLYYNHNKEMIFQKNEESSLKIVEMLEENLHLNMMHLEEQMKQFCDSEAVYDMLLADNDQVRYNFDQYVKENIHLSTRQSLCIIDLKGKYRYIKKNNDNLSTIDQKDIPSTGEYNWVVDKAGNGIHLIKEMRFHNNLIGYVSAGFSTQTLSSTLKNNESSNAILMVLDEKNQYLFGDDNFQFKEKIDIQKDHTTNIHNTTYLTQEKEIRNRNWKVIHAMNRDYLMEEVRNSRNMLILYIIILLLSEGFVSTLVYHSIYDPIHKILHNMRNIDANNLKNHLVVDEGKDELFELSTNFNDLLYWVKDLLIQVENEQEQKRETQIKLLQAQINPHFLFNTLNTLQYLAILNEDEPVSDGIKALSKLLRNTIIDNNEYVTVEEEIENVKNYIVIQKLRYGDLFETVYNIDEDVKQCRILKFLLQPIVENSILHAFDEDKDNQQIVIRVMRYNWYLKVEIADNGKGIIEKKKKSHLSGVGIKNIEERIHLMYGSSYSMHVESEVGKGTITTLLLPHIIGRSNS